MDSLNLKSLKVGIHVLSIGLLIFGLTLLVFAIVSIAGSYNSGPICMFVGAMISIAGAVLGFCGAGTGSVLVLILHVAGVSIVLIIFLVLLSFNIYYSHHEGDWHYFLPYTLLLSFMICCIAGMVIHIAVGVLLILKIRSEE